MQHEISHSEMVATLIKNGEVLVSETGPRDWELIHATIGIVGELGELFGGLDYAVTMNAPLDMVNVVEELGDLEFFLENFRTILSITRDDVLACETVCRVPPACLQMSAHMVIYGTELMDQVKKFVIYRKPLNREAIIVNLSKIEFLLTAFRYRVDVRYEDCLTANMAKLAIRYKGFQYSNEQAQNRADKSE